MENLPVLFLITLVVQGASANAAQSKTLEPHVNAIVGERGTKRQKQIAQSLYEISTFPYELIKIVIDYDAKIFTQHTGAIFTFALLSHNRLASAAANDKAVRIWNLETNRCLKVLQHAIAVTAIAALPSDELATGEGDASIKIWNTDTGTCRCMLTGHEYNVDSLIALPNDQLASTADHMHTRRMSRGASCMQKVRNWFQRFFDARIGAIKIWNITTGNEVRTIETEDLIHKLFILPNNNLAVLTCHVEYHGPIYQQHNTTTYSILMLDPTNG